MAWHVSLFIVQSLFTIRFFAVPQNKNNNNNKDLSHKIDQNSHLIQFTLCIIWMREHNSLCRERKAKIKKLCYNLITLLSFRVSFFFFFIPSSNKSNMLFYNWIWKRKKAKLIKHIDIRRVKQQQQQQKKNDAINKRQSKPM